MSAPESTIPREWSTGLARANKDESLSALIAGRVAVETPEQAVAVMKGEAAYSPLLYGRDPDTCPDAKARPRSKRVWDGQGGRPCIGTNHRIGNHFNGTLHLVLDVDNGQTIDDALNRLRGFRYALVTTRSHQKPKDGKPPGDRFRIALFLEQPITSAAMYTAAWHWATERFTGARADKACKDTARFYFSSPPDALVYTGEGALLVVPPNLKTQTAGKRRRADEGEQNTEQSLPGAEDAFWNNVKGEPAQKDFRHIRLLHIAKTLFQCGVGLKAAHKLAEKANDGLCIPPKPEDEVYNVVSYIYDSHSEGTTPEEVDQHTFGELLYRPQVPSQTAPEERGPIAGERLNMFVLRKIEHCISVVARARSNRKEVTERQCREIGGWLATPGCSVRPHKHIARLVEVATETKGEGAKGLPKNEAPALIPQWIETGRSTPQAAPIAILDVPGSENWELEDICLVGESGGWFVRKSHSGKWDFRTFYEERTIKKLLISEKNLLPEHVEGLLKSVSHPAVWTMRVTCSPRALVLTRDGLVLNTNPQGFVDPREGDWSDIRAYLACQVGEENMPWFLNWAAFCTQNPTRRPGTAVVITGPQGTGKTEGGKIVGYCRGTWVEIGHSDVTSGFNAHWAGSPFVIASELIVGEEKAKYGQNLKRYITDETVQRKIKHGSEAPVPNHSAWWITSNMKNPVPVEESDRRYAVFTSKMPPDDLHRRIKAAFDAYPDERRNEWPALRAFRHHLLQLAVDEERVRLIPNTQAHRDMQRLGMSSVGLLEVAVSEQGLSSVVERILASSKDGELKIPHGSINEIEGWASTDALKQIYLAWCKLEGIKYPVSGERFVQEISWPALPGRKRLKGDGTVDGGIQVRVRQVPMHPAAESGDKAA